MTTAIILASGTGSRMNSDIPKQYLPVCGRPVFIYSLQAFLSCGAVDCAVLVVSPEYADYAGAEIKKHISPDKKIYITDGGDSRGESLLKALAFCDENGLLDGTVLTHDSVRPFVSREIILDSIEKCRLYGAAIACVPATDTIFLTNGQGLIRAVPDRADIYHAQTPQTFCGRELYETILSLDREEFLKMTDAGSVYIRAGKKAAVSLGSHDNIKITYPGDLPLAETIAERLNLCHH